MALPQFIDTHHHLWDLENNPYPWLTEGIDHFVGDYSIFRRTYLISHLHKDAEGLPLVKSVHVQAEWDHEADPVGETTWLQSVADSEDSRGMPHAIIGFADLSLPGAPDLIARHAEHANWRGIRHMLNWAEDPKWQFADRNDLMTDPDWLRGYRALADHDGSFDLQVWPWQLEDAAGLAHRVPNVPIVLDHTGMPRDWDDEGIDLWRKGMSALASADNVSVKISALGMFSGEFTADRIRQFVLDTIDIFGVERCMFASNYPVDMLFTAYATIWNAYDNITADFTDSDREKLFMTNAERYYRI